MLKAEEDGTNGKTVFCFHTAPVKKTERWWRTLLSGQQVEHVPEGQAHLLGAWSRWDGDTLWWAQWVHLHLHLPTNVLLPFRPLSPVKVLMGHTDVSFISHVLPVIHCIYLWLVHFWSYFSLLYVKKNKTIVKYVSSQKASSTLGTFTRIVKKELVRKGGKIVHVIWWKIVY